MTRQIRIVLLIVFVMLLKSSAGQESLRVLGEVFKDDEGLDNVSIRVRDTSSLLNTHYTKASGNFDFKLSYGKQYTIRFYRKGYISKKVSINTHIPEDLDPTLQQLVLINVELLRKFNEYGGEEKPLGNIYFSRITEEFTYESRYSDNATTGFEVSGTDIQISHFLADDDATLQGIDSEEDIPLEGKLELKDQIIPEEAEDLADYQDGEATGVGHGEGTSSPDVSRGKRTKAPAWKIRFYRTIVQKRNEFLGEDPENIDLHKDLPGLGELENRLPFDTAISHYERQGIDVTEVIINDTKELDVYHRVKHQWGAVFYFKNYRPVTRTIFEMGIDMSEKQASMSP
jgi:hypothetical protein